MLHAAESQCALVECLCSLSCLSACLSSMRAPARPPLCSAAFGKDAAWLAEGAPSGSWDSAGRSRLLSGSLQAEHGTQQAAQQVQQQAAGQQAAVTLARTSPFQGVASHPVGSPPTSP